MVLILKMGRSREKEREREIAWNNISKMSSKYISVSKDKKILKLKYRVKHKNTTIFL